MNRKTVFLLVIAGVIALGAIGYFTAPLLRQEPETRPLHIDVPPHFMGAHLKKAYPAGKAIPWPGAISKVAGASISTQAHPDYPGAQLRIIQLPDSYLSTRNTAEILAASGAVQDCDIFVVFRPEYAPLNGYGNLQLGITHSAITFIKNSDGAKFVQTVESPLSYSSPMDYEPHYGSHDMFHIIRPNLSGSQKGNVREWSQRILEIDRERVPFYRNYGNPYAFREHQQPNTGNLPVDLALAILYPDLAIKVPVYCSELVWGLTALRDIDPSSVTGKFPEPGEELTRWLAERVNPIFAPLPAATDKPLAGPGLVQGPDVQMRNLLPEDDEARRKYLLENVLFERMRNPAQAEGIMSPGHLQSAVAYQPKVLQLRQWYGPGNEDPSALPQLNDRVHPNYSPTCFFFQANSPEQNNLHYVATVSFRSAPESGPENVAAE